MTDVEPSYVGGFEIPAHVDDLETVLGMAFGYVSVCWQDMQAGQFQSTEAKACLDAVLDWCRNRGWTKGAGLALAERARQISEKGYDKLHDSAQTRGQLARAAACYLTPSEYRPFYPRNPLRVPVQWPWGDAYWKPGDRKRELAKGVALGIAELDRILDAEEAASASQKEEQCPKE